MLATQLIVNFLVDKGVKNIYQLSGGMIMQLIDTIYTDGRLKLITVHHEQTASFAADAEGRYNSVPGVAIATSGPGATNLITGIASSYFDSSPAIFITGQVNRSEQKYNKNIRQLGFQETDIVSMVKPITKFAYKISSPSELEKVLLYAYNISVSGRPGPVLIDIPMDIFRSEVQDLGDQWNDEQFLEIDNHFNFEPYFEQILSSLANSKRPMILAGGGIRASKALSVFREFVSKLKVPVVSSLMAVDVLPYKNRFRAGYIGTYGNRWSNISLGSSDLLIVLGSRLDIRQTGADTSSFSCDKVIFHVDTEEDELNNRIKNCVAINCDLNAFLTSFLKYIEIQKLVFSESEFLNSIRELQKEYPDTMENLPKTGVNPNLLVKNICELNPNFDSFVADVGQHQMWTAQSLRLNDEQRFITSGGLGAMGFALPAAIAISLNTEKKVCVLCGDAGFQLNIQELETIRRNNLNILIIVLNNYCHGMTRQFQQTYFNERYAMTVDGYSCPDFIKVAKAYGIDSFDIESISDLFEIDISSPGARLLNVKIDTNLNAYPKLAFGLPISEMEPYAKPNDMEST